MKLCSSCLRYWPDTFLQVAANQRTFRHSGFLYHIVYSEMERLTESACICLVFQIKPIQKVVAILIFSPISVYFSKSKIANLEVNLFPTTSRKVSDFNSFSVQKRGGRWKLICNVFLRTWDLKSVKLFESMFVHINWLLNDKGMFS